MIFERDIVLCILRLTRTVRDFSLEDIAVCSGFARSLIERVIDKLTRENLVAANGRKLVVDGERRLKLACFAANLGCDVEKISRLLTWREFEAFCSDILENCGFKSFLNFRFKHRSGRGEIDVLGLRRPFILCMDAKHWGIRSGKASSLRHAIKKHVERVKFLSGALNKYMLDLGIEDWGKGVLVPLLVTLFQEKVMFDFDVPVVPIFKLNSFLMDFDSFLDELRFYRISLPKQRKII